MGGPATELTLTAVPTPNTPRYPVGSPPGVDMAHRGEALAAGAVAEAGTGGGLQQNLVPARRCAADADLLTLPAVRDQGTG